MAAKLQTYLCTRYAPRGVTDRTVDAANPTTACNKAFQLRSGFHWDATTKDSTEDTHYVVVCNVDNPSVNFRFKRAQR